MNATQTKPRTTTTGKPTTRPVQEILLDLAYKLHATKVVRRLPEKPLPPKG